MEDAVYGAIAGTDAANLLAGLDDDINIYILEPDLAARGLAEADLAAGLSRTDYGGFVDLVTEHSATQSWL